jgi:hypothetical protein
MTVCTQIGCTLQSLLGCVLPCIWRVGLFCPVGFRVKFGVQLQPQHCPAVCCLALGKPTCPVLCNLAVLYASLLELPCLVCLPLLLLLLLLWRRWRRWRRRRLLWDGVRQCETCGNAVLSTGGGGILPAPSFAAIMYCGDCNTAAVAAFQYCGCKDISTTTWLVALNHPGSAKLSFLR